MFKVRQDYIAMWKLKCGLQGDQGKRSRKEKETKN